MAKIKIVITPNTGKDAKKMDSHALLVCKMVQPFWKINWQFLKTFNTELPYDPAIVLLGISPTEMKTYACTKPVYECSQQLIFIIVPNWKQLKCDWQLV